MVNCVFLIVVSKVVNHVPHIVHLLVLNPGRAIKKITSKARKSKYSDKLQCQSNTIPTVINRNSLAYLRFNYKQCTITPIFSYTLIYFFLKITLII